MLNSFLWYMLIIIISYQLIYQNFVHYKKTQVSRGNLTRKTNPRKFTSTLRGNIKSALFPRKITTKLFRRKVDAMSRVFYEEIHFPLKLDVNVACTLRGNILRLLSEEILNPPTL